MSTQNATPPTPEADAITDALGRPLRDLRISVTDRCNFRCTYCMPKEVFGRDHKFLARDEILSFEEITRVARIFAGLGVRKLRLTGGEPTVRSGITDLVSMLADIEGVEDLAMTTNGSRLAKMAGELKAAGLHRVTVSLDSLDDKRFREISDAEYPVSLVLDGIAAAWKAGLTPVKINVVVKRGVNEKDALAIARRFRGDEFSVRLIEYMDVGSSNGWRMDDVVPAARLIAMLGRDVSIKAARPAYRGEVASRFKYIDGGEVGVIASVTQPFCGDCTRLRLSADGQLYTCLFAIKGHDLRALLRNGSTDEEVAGFLRNLWSKRKDRYSERRTEATGKGRDKIEMSYIGG
jgi:cyclic pyranopterin phosphate synthase